MAVITISHGTLSATQELASYLAEELHYQVIDREEVWEAAKVYGIEDTGLGKVGIVDQRPPSFWNRFTDTRRQYLVCFQAALLDFALQGRLVYIGHLAHLLLQDCPRVLRVRLAAPDGYRIGRLRDERAVTEAEARALVKQIDDRRLRWSQFLYDVDWRDPTHYDLVINPEKLTTSTIAALVLESAQSPELRPSEIDMRMLRDARLRTVAHAALLRSPRTRGLHAQIEADSQSGAVTVQAETSVVGGTVWREDIRTVLMQLEEIEAVTVVPSTTHIAE